MAETTMERAGETAKLPPEVRKALLALIAGGIAAILDSTMVTIALHTLAVTCCRPTARPPGPGGRAWT